MKAKPISPEEVVDVKEASLPEGVLEVFNDEIARQWNGSSALIKQNGLVERLVEKLGMTRDQIFANHFLDVEDIYRKAGWHVEYDKPGYNEDYEAYFKFSKDKNAQRQHSAQ